MLLTELLATVTSLVTLITAVVTLRRVGQVKEEVTTMNSLTMANMMDDNETRRIGQVDESDRTDQDNEHLRFSVDHIGRPK